MKVIYVIIICLIFFLLKNQLNLPSKKPKTKKQNKTQTSELNAKHVHLSQVNGIEFFCDSQARNSYQPKNDQWLSLQQTKQSPKPKRNHEQ